MPGRLAGRVVIITGGANGIGRTFAAACAAEGARIAIADIAEEAAAAAASEIRDGGAEAIALATDVSSAGSVQAMVDAVVTRFGRIDVLINNAAMMAGVHRRPFEQIEEAEWDRMMAVNVKGAFLCCRATILHMRRQRYGKIVNVASDTALAGIPGLLHYVASKGALIGFTRALCREVGDDGICVNTLAPGFTVTDAAMADEDGVQEERIGGRAIKRAEYPEDLTGTLLYLASSDSDFVTGQLFAVNGGYVLN